MSLIDVPVWGGIDGSLNSKRIGCFIKNSVSKNVEYKQHTLVPLWSGSNTARESYFEKAWFLRIGISKSCLAYLLWDGVLLILASEQGLSQRESKMPRRGSSVCDSSRGEQSVRGDRADSTHRFLPWVETSIPWEAAEQEKIGKTKNKKTSLCYLTAPRLIPQQ